MSYCARSWHFFLSILLSSVVVNVTFFKLLCVVLLHFCPLLLKFGYDSVVSLEAIVLGSLNISGSVRQA